MSKTITVVVPHRLSEDEARRRIQSGIDDFRRQYAGHLGNFEDHWAGNHVEGRFKVLGQTITGRGDVEAERVVIHVDLPWLLAKLVGKIQPQLQDGATKLLNR